MHLITSLNRNDRGQYSEKNFIKRLMDSEVVKKQILGRTSTITKVSDTHLSRIVKGIRCFLCPGVDYFVIQSYVQIKEWEEK